MKNILFSKTDGRVTAIPPASVIAIFTTAFDDKSGEGPHPNSIIMTNLRTLSNHPCLLPADAVASEIEEAYAKERAKPFSKKPSPVWAKLSAGGDNFYLQPESIESWEQIEVEGKPLIKVWWRPEIINRHTGLQIDAQPINVDDSESNINTLCS